MVKVGLKVGVKVGLMGVGWTGRGDWRAPELLGLSGAPWRSVWLVARCSQISFLLANFSPQMQQVLLLSCPLVPLTMATSLNLPTILLWAVVAACLPHPTSV